MANEEDRQFEEDQPNPEDDGKFLSVQHICKKKKENKNTKYKENNKTIKNQIN